ncbi:ATP-binding protein [Amycolatopsis sp. A133]|uniref:ATP-binding protein n=1 Tax=Amycolatopsis sp. A133 TaxID=3064472 RepID=UPI0027F478DC|nr:ATP-binding protein [Amycolatopsis sp. A133]MDQ7810715.1 ATP-binding protein [Amycolatopsis sp. A133]
MPRTTDDPGDEDRVAAVPGLQCRAVPADPGQLSALREDLAAWAARTSLPPPRAQDLLLAAYEAMANVIVHAYPGHAGTLTQHADNHADAVTVTVTDHGQWRPAPRPGLLGGGRGLPLIHALADHAAIETSAAGTTVTMTWTHDR